MTSCVFVWGKEGEGGSVRGGGGVGLCLLLLASHTSSSRDTTGIQSGERERGREGGKVIKFSHNWKLDSSHNTHYRIVNIILIHLQEDPLEATFVHALPHSLKLTNRQCPVRACLLYRTWWRFGVYKLLQLDKHDPYPLKKNSIHLVSDGPQLYGHPLDRLLLQPGVVLGGRAAGRRVFWGALVVC